MSTQQKSSLKKGQKITFTKAFTPRELQICSIFGTNGDEETLLKTHGPCHLTLSGQGWLENLILLTLSKYTSKIVPLIREQNLSFVRPPNLGETITLELDVKEKDEGNEASLSCEFKTSLGEVIGSGALIVSLSPEESSTESLTFQCPGHHHQHLVNRAKKNPPMKVGIVHPMDAISLLAAIEAHKQGFIEAVLIGPEARLQRLANDLNVDLSPYKIFSTHHSHESAATGVKLAKDGEVNTLMKGAIHTNEFLSFIIAKDSGLRTDRRMSHIMINDLPNYPKLLLVTDAAINILPDLECKVDIIQNAIDLAHSFGIEKPKVALLSAIETVNPKIQSTVDAAALSKMAERGQIMGGIIDGPLAFDNAISKESAEIKHIHSPVAGDPDILVCPDLESGNILVKQFKYLAGAQEAGIVMGAKVPFILTSRSEDINSRVVSAAIANLLFHHRHGTHR
ncbi:bifunctional enoyl-CoA hydratase/phosphate acetyltransferase [Candidatus Nucleicultrix amoebiphila]|uniref:bifunctional enoyl-CoA hydratase/phosphate acetyltransferase n=1 Tax=Candidatus Nucleicultrix amoebiphila TaxID=1509244 RepID=UPI0018DC657B|nr:bifunctional enoyl-CoA hydratase/phosphate acetyltransferase [Candidatus Nucleicultrix amoebiphila]